MKTKTSTGKMERRYQSLASKLAGTGLILQGTITERTIEKKPVKNQDQPQTYGPYYQWTYKRAGKTVTVNLTSKQAKLYQSAIDNNRELERTINEMRKFSREICEEKTEGVKKRKSSK